MLVIASGCTGCAEQSPAPPAGTSLTPLVTATGGATVGETVAQVQSQDASATSERQSPGAEVGQYLIDSNVLFVAASSPQVSTTTLPPTAVIGQLDVTAPVGNC